MVFKSKVLLAKHYKVSVEHEVS